MSDIKAFDKADYGLHPVRVDSFGPLVLVCLDPAARPLDELVGDLTRRLSGYRMDEWQVSREATYEIEANWKLVAENFMEYYHLPWVHPGLVKVSPMNAHYRWQGPGTYVGFCTTPIASNADEGGWQGLPAISGQNEVDAVSARFVVLFPNVALSVLPNHVFMMLMHPTSPGHTSEQTFLLTNPESLDDEGSEAGDRRAHAVLGQRQPRGHRDRRASSSGAREHVVHGRTHVLPLRGVRCTASRTW